MVQRTGYASLATYPEGALIYINNKLKVDEKGQPIRTPATIELYEGSYNIMFYLEGYCRIFTIIYVLPGQWSETFRNFGTCPGLRPKFGFR